MMEQMRDTWEWIREHDIDSVVLVGCGVIIAVLGVLGVASPEVITSVAIALLSAVAALLLSTDKRESRFVESANTLGLKLDTLETLALSEGEASGAFSFEYPDLTSLIAAATEVDVVAGLALNVSNQYHGSWRQALERGLHLRLLCPEPTDPGVVSHALFRSIFRKSAADVTDDVRSQITFAAALRDAGGKLELKLSHTCRRSDYCASRAMRWMM